MPWVRGLEQAIGAAKAAIVLIGPHGFGNTQQYERELAFIRQTRDAAFPAIHVLLPEEGSDRSFDFLQALPWIHFSPLAMVSDAPAALPHLHTALQRGKS